MNAEASFDVYNETGTNNVEVYMDVGHADRSKSSFVVF